MKQRLSSPKVWIVVFMVVCWAVVAAAQEAVTLSADVKPGSCKDSINIKSRGVTPMALLGEVDVDVRAIDVLTVVINTVIFEDIDYALGQPLKPKRSGYEDIANPLDCQAGPDGYEDLTLKFKTQEIIAALLGVETDEDLLADGTHLTLVFTGALQDDTPFEAQGELLIKAKGKGKGKPDRY